MHACMPVGLARFQTAFFIFFSYGKNHLWLFYQRYKERFYTYVKFYSDDYPAPVGVVRLDLEKDCKDDVMHSIYSILEEHERRNAESVVRSQRDPLVGRDDMGNEKNSANFAGAAADDDETKKKSKGTSHARKTDVDRGNKRRADGGKRSLQL